MFFERIITTGKILTRLANSVRGFRAGSADLQESRQLLTDGGPIFPCKRNPEAPGSWPSTTSLVNIVCPPAAAPACGSAGVPAAADPTAA
ncbi:hypothetical protein, partial [Paenibacillus sp. HGH0039]